jgi:hypothetical protein
MNDTSRSVQELLMNGLLLCKLLNKIAPGTIKRYVVVIEMISEAS